MQKRNDFIGVVLSDWGLETHMFWDGCLVRIKARVIDEFSMCIINN